MYPHDRRFPLRRPIFWGVSVLGVVLGLRTPGLTLTDRLGAVVLAAVLAAAVFRYTLWLVRIDHRFQDVNPYKIRVTTLGVFYGSIGTGLAVLLVGAWLPFDPAKSAVENASPLLFVPALLASAAGALRAGREGGVLD